MMLAQESDDPQTGGVIPQLQRRAGQPSVDEPGILLGAGAIADFLGITPSQVYRLAGEGSWPVFRLRSKLAARRSALLAHIDRLECQASASRMA